MKGKSKFCCTMNVLKVVETKKIILCGRHSSVVSSAPTILRPQVRIPSTPSKLFSICIIEIVIETKINKKRPGLAHLKKRLFCLQNIDEKPVSKVTGNTNVKSLSVHTVAPITHLVPGMPSFNHCVVILLTPPWVVTLLFLCSSVSRV